MRPISKFVPRQASSFTSFHIMKQEEYLPLTHNNNPAPRLKVGALLGHCHYRRVCFWTIFLLLIVTGAFFNAHWSGTSQDVLDIVKLGNSKSGVKPSYNSGGSVAVKAHGAKGILAELQHQTDSKVVSDSEKTTKSAGELKIPAVLPGEDIEIEEEEELLEIDDSAGLNGPKWLRWKHLDGFYNGLRSLVPFAHYKPEYPNSPSRWNTMLGVPHHAQLPRASPYRSHPDYNSDEYRSTFVPVLPCYLDAANQIPAPDIYAFNGVPQGQPEPVLGSFDVLGIREDVCFDRFGRYGPYGLGYPIEQGGSGEGLDTEHEGNEVVWEKTGQINYDNMDWADAQERCVEANTARFFTGNKTHDTELAQARPQRISRTAVVIRTFTGFKWTSHVILNFRAMITELNLKSGGEYDVHFLLHVHDSDAPIWADPGTAQRILDANVPPEFHGVCTLWSEAQMKLFYPGDFGDSFDNPSWADIHGVYRSAHMPLQHFAMMHPEYEHFWNWEMDMRYSGSYYELYDRLSKWAAKQSRKGMWERSSKYYIPAFHGSWENFTQTVEEGTLETGKRLVIGPVVFAGKSNLLLGDDFMPSSCQNESNLSSCGVDEEADLITLNPLFDPDNSGWVFSGDVTGYDMQHEIPPRRSAIVTASRMSRRLLSVMHEETWRLHHSMFTEMFPAAMSFHHGLKAVYAPHPVFIDRQWPISEVDKAFNGGQDHTTSGQGSPFDIMNEHNHKGTSWYYNSEFASLLWKRWLGYAQFDGRGQGGGMAGQGEERGGRRDEENPVNSGRLCLRSMLFHPIKHETPAEEGY